MKQPTKKQYNRETKVVTKWRKWLNVTNPTLKDWEHREDYKKVLFDFIHGEEIKGIDTVDIIPHPTDISSRNEISNFFNIPKSTLQSGRLKEGNSLMNIYNLLAYIKNKPQSSLEVSEEYLKIQLRSKSELDIMMKNTLNNSNLKIIFIYNNEEYFLE